MHYFVKQGNLNIALKQYLKQVDMLQHYDSIKRRIYRKYVGREGDVIIESDSELLVVPQDTAVKKVNREVASELLMK